MTSFATETMTRKFFEEHRFFGLKSSQVIFFSQGELPCITPEGKVIFEAKGKVHASHI